MKYKQEGERILNESSFSLFTFQSTEKKLMNSFKFPLCLKGELQMRNAEKLVVFSALSLSGLWEFQTRTREVN